MNELGRADIDSPGGLAERPSFFGASPRLASDDKLLQLPPKAVGCREFIAALHVELLDDRPRESARCAGLHESTTPTNQLGSAGNNALSAKRPSAVLHLSKALFETKAKPRRGVCAGERLSTHFAEQPQLAWIGGIVSPERAASKFFLTVAGKMPAMRPARVSARRALVDSVRARPCRTDPKFGAK